MSQETDGKKMIAVNKKAHFNYHILETFQAGIALMGTEVKALREKRVQMGEANVGINNGEAFLYNCHIAEYSHGNINNHEPLRIRKLLLHRKEINRFVGFIREQGHTIIPLRIYFQRGKVKVDIAHAKGKKLFDKRDDMKKKVADREIAQNLKRNLRQ
ncbi:MAG: SsrA-binding protein SmpB [Nitrospinae bacterium]|nr:SsrA-binding protein SmpB [Nitrospinota bacterium]